MFGIRSNWKVIWKEFKHFIRYLKIKENDRCYSSPDLRHKVIKETIQTYSYMRSMDQDIKVAQLVAQCRYCTKNIHVNMCITRKEELQFFSNLIGLEVRKREEAMVVLKDYGIVSCLE